MKQSVGFNDTMNNYHTSMEATMGEALNNTDNHA